MARPEEVDHGWMHGKIFRLKVDCPHASEYRGYWEGSKPAMTPTPYSKGDLVKVVMVSRFGDCGITTRLRAKNGYAARVEPEDLFPQDFERSYPVVHPAPTWKGNLLDTFGAVYDAMQSCKTPEEAKKFMEFMREHDQHADSNIGYLTGYCSPVEAERLREWLGVKHPIFGDKNPTPEEAFKKGMELGKKRET